MKEKIEISSQPNRINWKKIMNGNSAVKTVILKKSIGEPLVSILFGIFVHLRVGQITN
jgi:hypothetical protein